MNQIDLYAPMSVAEESVWHEIESHIGRAQAISVSELQARTGLSHRVVRLVVAELIDRHGCPIGSSSAAPSGYWVLEDPAELDEAAAMLYARAYHMLRRIARIKKVSLEEVFGQLSLFAHWDGHDG